MIADQNNLFANVVKHFIKKCFICLLFAVSWIIHGCSEENNTPSLGSDLLESRNRVALIDTFSVSASTILLDSVATSGQSNALVGAYTDPYLGKVRSESYFQLDYPYSYSLDQMEYYDSTVLILHFNEYWYGDTHKSLNINVYKVTENLITKYNQSDALYNRSRPSVDPLPIGRKQFIPVNAENDSIVIRLDDNFGMFLMNVLKNNSLNPFDVEDFPSFYLNGLALMSDLDTDASIIGFKVDTSNIKLRMYTHLEADYPEKYRYDFRLVNPQIQFNRIISDRTGTPVSILMNQKSAVPSSKTGDLTFLEGGIGIVTKFQFPSLGQLILQDSLVILKAELEISPVRSSYPKKYRLPSPLMAYETDASNTPVVALKSYNGYPVYGILKNDDLYNEETKYTFDITTFIKNELADNIFDYNHAIMLWLYSNYLYSSTDRLVIEAGPFSRNKPKLKIYFFKY